MEILIVVVFAILLVIIIKAAFRSARAFKGGHAETNAPSILDREFDGRRDVAFTINAGTLSYETVVIGAKQRGYRITSESREDARGAARTLIFEKREGA